MGETVFFCIVGIKIAHKHTTSRPKCRSLLSLTLQQSGTATYPKSTALPPELILGEAGSFVQVMEVTKEFLACVQAQLFVHICKSKLDLHLYLHTYKKIAALMS